MPVDYKDLIDLLAQICDDNNLRCCIKECLKGSLLTGFSAGIGGLLLGPVGFAIGGIIGGTGAAVSAKGKFQPASKILLNMNSTDRQKLYERFRHAFRNFGIQDLTCLAALILSRTDFQELAFKEVKNFLSQDMNLSLQS